MTPSHQLYVWVLFVLLLGDTCRTRMDVRDLQERVDALEGRP